MFKNTYQSGLLSIFYSCGSNPLAIWDMEVQNGHIKRLTDAEVNSIVLEINFKLSINDENQTFLYEHADRFVGRMESDSVQFG
ncbi:unnamed protein product [Colias eurytheme]|nr:unnamed protein product [Colias eurytheme]